MRLVYGAASPYLAFAPLLRLFVLAFLLQYLATVVGAYEGGLSRPKTYMWVQIVSTAILLTAGVWFIRVFGVAGAVDAMFLASAARLVTFLLLAWAADRPHISLRNALMEPSHE
jgi:O-antigen/teichoic acid export membrane protein